MTVTAPLAFRAAGVAAGIKASGGLDLALVVNDGPQPAAAGVFTRNRVRAAPVLWTEQAVRGGVLRAVVLNSGGANAATGSAGFQDAHAMAEKVAEVLSAPGMLESPIGAGEVGVCSTGLIGERLPMAAVLAGIEAAASQLSRDGGAAAARAIMTTDTRPKTVAIGGSGYMVGGMAKGAGMLAPALATMLCVLTTDAVAPAALLHQALTEACRITFDRLDSDGCCSTNDTVLLLASGASGVRPDAAELTELVTAACHELVRQLLADAEGSTKDITIEVVGAAHEADAVQVGRAVARNNLVKTALFGNDPNWGRILAAVGTTQAAFDPAKLDVAVNGVWVCRGGQVAEDRAKVDLTGRAVSIVINLNAGADQATIWTNDLSLGYVHENSAYST